MPSLDADQLRQFDRDGYLLLHQVIPLESLQGVVRSIEKTVDRKARELLHDGMIANLYTNEPFERRWQAIVAEIGSRQTRRSWDDDVIDESFFDLMRNPALVDVIESLLGSEILAMGIVAVRPKIPGDNRTTVLWHQDSHYFGNDSASQDILTVWLPLVRADHHNGCLQVIPGSHRWGLQAAEKDPIQNVFRPVEDPTKRGEPVTCEMEVGDLLVFNNLTFHRSTENHSDHTRWSIDLRYCSPSTQFDQLSRFIPGFIARSITQRVDHWPEWQSRINTWRQTCVMKNA